MYNELKFRYALREADGEQPTAQPSQPTGASSELKASAKLSQETLAKVNDAKEGRLNWQEVQDSAKTSEERSAISEIFLLNNKNIQPYLQYLQNGMDIVISWVNQLGFKEINNPYLKFIPTFFKIGGNTFNLTRDDIIVWNDMYANELVDEADMMGTGKEGTGHIIFDGADGGLYRSDAQGMGSAQTMLQFIKYYNYFGNQANVEKLNIQAIMSMESGPYPKKFQEAGIKIDEKGHLDNILSNYGSNTWKLVRPIIMYKYDGALNDTGASQLESTPAKLVETFYYVDKAYKLGLGTSATSSQSKEANDVITRFENGIKNGEFTKEQIARITQTMKERGLLR